MEDKNYNGDTLDGDGTLDDVYFVDDEKDDSEK